MSRKRLSQEFDSLKKVKEPTKAAKIHGVVSHVSPMKKGKYYEAFIGHKTCSKRLVGFHKYQRDTLASFKDSPVTLDLAVF